MGMPSLVPRLLQGPFTVADYYRMAETGVLAPDARTELLEGQVVPMSAIGLRHANCVNRLSQMLFASAAGRATVSVQNPVILSKRSVPQPDVALWKPRADHYAGGLPGPSDLLLVVEVSDTTANWDREVKIPLYARSGIGEAWLVDIQADTIEVYLEPGEDGYAVVRNLRGGETLTPSLLPGVILALADILG